MRCHIELPEEYLVQRNLRSVIGSKGTFVVPWKHSRQKIVKVIILTTRSLERHNPKSPVICTQCTLNLHAQSHPSRLYQTSDMKLVSFLAGNGGVGILHLSSISDENQSCAGFDQKLSVAKTTRLCFVDDGMECADMRLLGVFKCRRRMKSRGKPQFLQTCLCTGEPREQHLSQLHSRRRSSGLVVHDQVTSAACSEASVSCLDWSFRCH